MMPFCPNCGSYIPLGNHSCSCGTTIAYDDEDYDGNDFSLNQRSGNPYDDTFSTSCIMGDGL